MEHGLAKLAVTAGILTSMIAFAPVAEAGPRGQNRGDRASHHRVEHHVNHQYRGHRVSRSHRHGYHHIRKYRHHSRSRTSVSFNFSTGVYPHAAYFGSRYYRPWGYSSYNAGFYSPSYRYYPQRTVIVTRPQTTTYVQATPATKSPYTAPVNDTNSSCLQTREYQTTITIGGEDVPAYGTACLQPDGSWKEGPAQPAQ